MFYKEYISLFESHRKEKNALNEKITSSEQSLKDKIAEVTNILHEKSNVVSLTNVFQKEREFLHEDQHQDAHNVYNKLRVNMNRRGLGFSEFDNKPAFKSSKTLKNTLC